MLVSNSASYIYFLPDDISHAIFDSKEVNDIYDKRNEKEEQSRLQFSEDTKTLFSNHRKGRWHNRLLPDPYWDNKPFGGSWSGPSIGSFENNFPTYSFHCSILIKGRKVEISYSVRHFLETYEFELRLSQYDKDVIRIFEERLNIEGYSIKRKLPIGEPVYSFAIYAEGNNPKDFVSTYMNVLDEVIKL